MPCKSSNLGGVWVIHPLQRRPGLNQAVAHAVYMAMLQRHGCKNKFSGLAHRLGLAHRRIEHSIAAVHTKSLPDCNLISAKRLAHIHRPDLLDRFPGGRIRYPFLQHLVIQIFVQRQVDPIVGPGGQMHGIGQGQSVDSLFARRNQWRSVQNGVRKVLDDAVMLRIVPRNRHLAFPAFRFAEAPVYC